MCAGRFAAATCLWQGSGTAPQRSGVMPPPGAAPHSREGEGKIGLRGGGVVGAPRRRVGGGSGNGAPVTEPLVKYQSP